MFTFEISRGRNNLFYWRLKSGEKILCWSAGYETFRGAKNALLKAKKTNQFPYCTKDVGAELREAPIETVIDV
jgi:uncharacterized protein YegP (UPF0339 family)